MATLTNAEKNFLKYLALTVKHPLNIAWLLTVLGTLLFVWQSWLLASIFSTWLTNYFNELPLSTNVSIEWFAGLLVCFIVRPLLSSARQLISSRASLRLRSQLRASLLQAMAILGPNLKHFGSDGSLSSQIIEQTDALDGFISSFSVQKKVAASTPIILLIAIASQSLLAAFLLLLTAPLVPIFMILIGHLTARKSADQFNALAQLSGRFLDWVRGMPTLKRLQATQAASRDLEISSENYRRRTMDVLKIAFLNGAVLELLAALSIALVAVYLGFGLMGILPWDKGHIPVQYFGALFILLLAPEFYLPLRQLGADYHAKAEAEGAVQSLLPIIEAAKQSHNSATDFFANNTITKNSFQNNFEKNPTPDPNQDINDPLASTYSIDISKAFGIRLNELNIKSPILTTEDDNQNSTSSKASNRYPNYRSRLAPISLEIKAGERIALVGNSGSGKSSLLQTLMRFVSYEGEIYLTDSKGLQNIDLSSIKPDILRQHIGYLAQQVALMPITIRENLLLANPDANEDELTNVLDTVGLWDLIQRLPNGIDTQLGERGQGLSGGQQQRLGIAQLLLRDDSLWLLDEPTEHLDPKTAQHINQLLENVSRNKTVIWVTHAVEELNWVDKVIRLSIPDSHTLTPIKTLTQPSDTDTLGGAK